jgi:hypothetical protein
MKTRIAMAKAAFENKKNFHSQIGLKFKVDSSKSVTFGV